MLIVDMPMPRKCRWIDDDGHIKKCHLLDTVTNNCKGQSDAVNETAESWKDLMKGCPIKGELVRCGECYYKEEKRIMDEDVLWCRKHHMYVTADWFCGDGERKDGE